MHPHETQGMPGRDSSAHPHETQGMPGRDAFAHPHEAQGMPGRDSSVHPQYGSRRQLGIPGVNLPPLAFVEDCLAEHWMELEAMER